MRYWNDKPPFKWLRKKFNIEKPTALEWGEWDNWNEATKAAHPIGWFMTETVPSAFDWLEKHTIGYVYEIRYYMRNRFIRKTHYLRTGLDVGAYHDLDTRIMHGLMEGIVDYVEIEVAYKSRWVGTDESKKAKWKNGRCPQLGLEYLKWEMGLRLDEDWGITPGDEKYGELTDQAHRAIDALKLYVWWKFDRPRRPDPMDASGWSQYCDDMREKYGERMFFRRNETEEENARSAMTRKKMYEIEAQYEAEDEAMLLQIIKIRKGLWT